ncbi:MAG: hypothetical protein CXR31_07880 [Geobacter sp.]|nr:MAG: hypothetical protein CXR31_07880 [Geobacter sp.]
MESESRRRYLPGTLILERAEAFHPFQGHVLVCPGSGVALARELDRKTPISAWERERNEIRRTIEARGYDSKRGIFVQAFDSTDMDASLLLLPTTGFVTYRDDRMLRTTDAVMKELSEGGILRRYPAGSDGLAGERGGYL